MDSVAKIGTKNPNILPEQTDNAQIKKALDSNSESKTFAVPSPATPLYRGDNLIAEILRICLENGEAEDTISSASSAKLA